MSLLKRIQTILKTDQKSEDSVSFEQEINKTLDRLYSELHAKRAQKERLTKAIFEHKDNIIKFDHYFEKALADNDTKLSNANKIPKESSEKDLKKLKEKNIKLAEQLEKMDQTYEMLSGRLEDYQIRIEEAERQKEKNKMDKEFMELEAYEEQLQYEVEEAKALIETTQNSFDLEFEKEMHVKQ